MSQPQPHRTPAGLHQAIAQASIYDEICQAVSLPEEDITALTRARTWSDRSDPDDGSVCTTLLRAKGWTQEDLRYFASKGERLNRFQQRVFKR